MRQPPDRMIGLLIGVLECTTNGDRWRACISFDPPVRPSEVGPEFATPQEAEADLRQRLEKWQRHFDKYQCSHDVVEMSVDREGLN